MRVIAGKYKSRKLKTLAGQQTRPTLEQVKESFFNRLGPYFDGGIICDVFGGSGSILIEFLSRGVEQGIIIENNRGAIQVIKENLMNVDEPVKVFPISYQSALKKIEGPLDYIYCDPPYQFNEKQKLFDLLRPLMNHESLLFYEADAKEQIDVPEFLEIIRIDQYRRTQILWLRVVQSQKDGDPFVDLVGN